jgi:hypothetical protein
MKTNRNFHTSKRIYWIALVIAVLVASMLPLRGFASSNSSTGQAGFGISTIQKIGTADAPAKDLVEHPLRVDARFIHSKMIVATSVTTGTRLNSAPSKSVAIAVADLIDEVAPAEVAVAEEIAPAAAETIGNEVVASNPGETTPAGVETVAVSAPVSTVSGLAAFAAKVTNGNGGQITGLYSENLFALSVVQQSGDASYVSTAGNTTTQFSMASGLGFLAHNYLSGSLFFYLYGGAPITVVYGDGHTQSYRVSQIRKFQALSPDSPYSDFVDLASGSTLSATDLFYATYGVGGQLVLQTCIAANGNSSWGRLFVIATPAG